MNKITIITPTCNDADFMSTLIKSMDAQTNKNFSWIIIDDGSSNKYKKILTNELRNIKHNDLKVIFQNNNGVSSARNNGIINCKTEWIMFIDSDDSINDNFIKNFYDIQNRDKYKLIISKFYNKKKINKFHISKINKKHPKFSCGNIENKIFKLSLIKSVFNNKISIGEDLDFFIHYVNNIANNEIYFLDSFIIYAIRSNSSSRKLHNSKYLDVLTISEEWLKIYDLNEKKNMYIVSAINEHAYIYTFIRFHIAKNKANKNLYKRLLSSINVKRIIIRERSIILLILSVIFYIHFEFILIPFIIIYGKFYFNK